MFKTKKVQHEIKEGSISKELEDSLLGVGYSTTSSSSAVSVVNPSCFSHVTSTHSS